MARPVGSIVIKDRDPLICNYYNQVKSTPKTAKRFGLTQVGVWYILKKYNVDTYLSRDDKRILNQKYDIDETYFEKIDTRDKAYIFGLLLADGHIHKNKRQFSISLTDTDMVENIKTKLRYNGNCIMERKTSRSYNVKPIKKLTVSNYKMTEDLFNHGMCLNKTMELKMPNIRYDLFGDFIRGFFDGDGCVTGTVQYGFGKICVSFISTEKFCEGIKEQLSIRGIKACIINGRGLKEGIKRVSIATHSDAIKMYWLMYKDIDGQMYFQRKYEKFRMYFRKRKEDILKIITDYQNRLNELPAGL